MTSAMADADPQVTAAFRWQADKCREMGSPFTGALLDQAAASLEAGGAAAEAVGRWPGKPLPDALPLRFTGALHAVVLEGGDSALAAAYPRPERQGDPGAAWAAAESYISREPQDFARRLESPPQTNETGRALGLFPGLLRIAARFGLPLDLYELGASAGLNLNMDGFGYRTAVWSRGGSVPIEGEWRGRAPEIDVQLTVEERCGCDQNPVNPRSEEGRRRLRSYLWADQFERRARLDAALALAEARGTQVERADAADWVEARLKARRSGVVSVIYHSVFWQYPPEETRRRIEAAIRSAGAAASAAAPLAWLRFEPEAAGSVDDRLFRYGVDLTTWPGGEREVLAEVDPHGRWVEWRG
jgi:hypothetical protein